LSNTCNWKGYKTPFRRAGHICPWLPQLQVYNDDCVRKYFDAELSCKVKDALSHLIFYSAILSGLWSIINDMGFVDRSPISTDVYTLKCSQHVYQMKFMCMDYLVNIRISLPNLLKWASTLVTIQQRLWTHMMKLIMCIKESYGLWIVLTK